MWSTRFMWHIEDIFFSLVVLYFGDDEGVSSFLRYFLFLFTKTLTTIFFTNLALPLPILMFSHIILTRGTKPFQHSFMSMRVFYSIVITLWVKKYGDLHEAVPNYDSFACNYSHIFSFLDLQPFVCIDLAEWPNDTKPLKTTTPMSYASLLSHEWSFILL